MEIDWARGNIVIVDGREVARAERSWLRERAEVQIGSQSWLFRSDGWAGSTLRAELDGVTHFAARRSGFLTSRWTFDVGEQLTLAQTGWFGTRLTLSRGSSVIGQCVRSGLVTSRPRLELVEDLEVRIACFVLWVAYVELNRQSSD